MKSVFFRIYLSQTVFDKIGNMSLSSAESKLFFCKCVDLNKDIF